MTPRRMLALLALEDGATVEYPLLHRQVFYRPRNAHDSRPWTDGSYRFTTGELAIVHPKP